jgi:hypothetical protein
LVERLQVIGSTPRPDSANISSPQFAAVRNIPSHPTWPQISSSSWICHLTQHQVLLLKFHFSWPNPWVFADEIPPPGPQPRSNLWWKIQEYKYNTARTCMAQDFLLC